MATNNQSKTWLQGVLNMVKPNPVQINPGDAYRLNNAPQVIRVVSGSAWISYDGKDVVLRKGRNMYLPKIAFPAVLSPIGEIPVLLEIQPR